MLTLLRRRRLQLLRPALHRLHLVLVLELLQLQVPRVAVGATMGAKTADPLHLQLLQLVLHQNRIPQPSQQHRRPSRRCASRGRLSLWHLQQVQDQGLQGRV